MTERLELLDVVVIRSHGEGGDAPVGASGTIVEVYEAPELACEVEVVGDDGRTSWLGPLRADQVERSVGGDSWTD